MPGESDNEVAKSVGELIADILIDIRKLVWQEIRLAKHEFRQGLRKTLTMLLSITTGVAFVMVGGLLFVFMLVHLINALTELPLWACYGIVAGTFAAIGIFLLVFGMKVFKQLHIIPA